MMPILDKLSSENKDIMIMGDFNVNLINYNDDKNASNFSDTMLSHSFLPFITTIIRITKNTKTLKNFLQPLNDIMSGNTSSRSELTSLKFTGTVFAMILLQILHLKIFLKL